MCFVRRFYGPKRQGGKKRPSGKIILHFFFNKKIILLDPSICYFNFYS